METARHCTGGIVGRAASSQYLADLPLAVSAGYANHAGSCDCLIAALRRTTVLFQRSSVRTAYKQCAAGKKSKHGDLRDAQALLLAHRLQSHRVLFSLNRRVHEFKLVSLLDLDVAGVRHEVFRPRDDVQAPLPK